MAIAALRRGTCVGLSAARQGSRVGDRAPTVTGATLFSHSALHPRSPLLCLGAAVAVGFGSKRLSICDARRKLQAQLQATHPIRLPVPSGRHRSLASSRSSPRSSRFSKAPPLPPSHARCIFGIYPQSCWRRARRVGSGALADPLFSMMGPSQLRAPVCDPRRARPVRQPLLCSPGDSKDRQLLSVSSRSCRCSAPFR